MFWYKICSTSKQHQGWCVSISSKRSIFPFNTFLGLFTVYIYLWAERGTIKPNIKFIYNILFCSEMSLWKKKCTHTQIDLFHRERGEISDCPQPSVSEGPLKWGKLGVSECCILQFLLVVAPSFSTLVDESRKTMQVLKRFIYDFNLLSQSSGDLGNDDWMLKDKCKLGSPCGNFHLIEQFNEDPSTKSLDFNWRQVACFYTLHRLHFRSCQFAHRQ